MEPCYILTTLNVHQGPWLHTKTILKSNVTNVITLAVISMINPTNLSVIEGQIHLGVLSKCAD